MYLCIILILVSPFLLLDAKFDMFLVRTVAFIGRTVCAFCMTPNCF